METTSIAPKALTREEIITDGGIPSEVFDYIDKELRGDWFPATDRLGERYEDWKTEKRMEIDGHWKWDLTLERPGPRTKKGYIRVIGPANNTFAQSVYYRGPLTIESAQEAISVARNLMD